MNYSPLHKFGMIFLEFITCMVAADHIAFWGYSGSHSCSILFDFMNNTFLTVNAVSLLSPYSCSKQFHTTVDLYDHFIGTFQLVTWYTYRQLIKAHALHGQSFSPCTFSSFWNFKLTDSNWSWSPFAPITLLHLPFKKFSSYFSVYFILLPN